VQGESGVETNDEFWMFSPTSEVHHFFAFEKAAGISVLGTGKQQSLRLYASRLGTGTPAPRRSRPEIVAVDAVASMIEPLNLRHSGCGLASRPFYRRVLVTRGCTAAQRVVKTKEI